MFFNEIKKNVTFENYDFAIENFINLCFLTKSFVRKSKTSIDDVNITYQSHQSNCSYSQILIISTFHRDINNYLILLIQLNLFSSILLLFFLIIFTIFEFSKTIFMFLLKLSIAQYVTIYRTLRFRRNVLNASNSSLRFSTFLRLLFFSIKKRLILFHEKLMIF